MKVITPGTLSSLLTTTEKLTVTKLNLTGTIDARDVKFMRDSMSLLADIDLKDVSIAEYTGINGTMGPFDWSYPKNTFPDGAFSKVLIENSTLKSIILPSSLTSIGRNAFGFCTSLTNIFIPKSVTSIQMAAFYKCTGLTTITIPSNVTSIENDAFRECLGLTTITIQNGITSIGSSAFRDCSKLKSINIPASVTSIAINMFVGCTSLTSISVDATSKYLSSVDGVLFSKDKSVLLCYPAGSLETYTVPASVTTIEHGAFSGCSGLKSVILPSSVTSIKNLAFQGCTNLTSISAYSAKPVDLNSSVSPFDKVNTTTCILYVPVGSKNIYQTATEWKKFTNIVEK